LGQAQPISAGASGLVGYPSQYQGVDVPKGIEEELPPDPERLRVRGEAERDEEVHRLISWTTRKNYPTFVGISLPIQDPVGGEFHEGQLWEDVLGDLIIEDKHVEQFYSYLSERLRAPSSENMLPVDIPASIEEVTVQTWKDGREGHILFTPKDSLTTPMKKMEVQVVIDYEEEFMKVRMENAYPITMLA
jgi:hypothetical protein